MNDVTIIRQGHFTKDGVPFSDGNQSHLLYNRDNFEAVVEVMPKGTVGCFYTMTDNAFLFDYVIRGRMELRNGGETQIVEQGDVYCYSKLARNVMFHILEDTELLSINTDPCYDDYQYSVEVLNDVLSNLQRVDGDTLEHCTRVKNLCMGIAYFYHFDETQLLDLFYAAKFHDVGKSKIPTEILLKSSRLTAEEYQIMKEHSRYTYEMILEYYGQNVANIAFEHHESIDGSGYPRNLSGDQICVAARILTVSDAFDAMVVTRPYRKALTNEAAIAELRRCQGTQFDSAVIDALEAYLER